jgi:hypothetical protein
MAVAWSSDASYTFDAYIGVAFSTGLPITGGSEGSGNALDLAAGESGLPHGLAISADYAAITGTPDGLASTGSSSPYDKSGPGIYKATLTNGTTTKQFVIKLHSALIADSGGYDTEQADAARTLTDDLTRLWPETV